MDGGGTWTGGLVQVHRGFRYQLSPQGCGYVLGTWHILCRRTEPANRTEQNRAEPNQSELN